MNEDLDDIKRGLDSEPSQDELFRDLRPVDRKRIDAVYKHTVEPYGRDDIWFVHAVLAQCFLPYRDPKTRDWDRKNGKYAISLTSGRVLNPETGDMETMDDL